jgi:hypothetical protein
MALDSDLPLFLVGDYNCDMLSNSSNYFKKILNRLNLENVVFEATHFTTDTGTTPTKNLSLLLFRISTQSISKLLIYKSVRTL